MTDQHHFSVIIPVYNKVGEVGRAIDSVLQQTVQDFELIVVDDGSTDGSATAAKAFRDDRIRYYTQENQGVSAARNLGITKARYPLISFLDADDEWLPPYLETILGLLSRFPKAGLYATAYRMQIATNRIRLPKLRSIPKAPWEGIIPDFFQAAAGGNTPVCSSAVTVRKDVLDKVGVFKEGELLGEDLDLWGRIALEYPICFSWQAAAVYHLEATNRACLRHIPEKPFPFVETARQAIAAGTYGVNPDSLIRYVNKLKFLEIWEHIKAGNRKKARQLLANCPRTNRARIAWYYLWAFMPQSIRSLGAAVKNILHGRKSDPSAAIGRQGSKGRAV